MDIYGKIKQAIKEMASSKEFQPLFNAEVDSIQDDRCTVIFDDVKLTGVRLKPVTGNSDQEILITPKIGSFVMVANLSGDLTDLCVISISAIDKISIKKENLSAVLSDDNILFNNGKSTLKITENEILFNDGSFGGLVKAESLVGWMQKVYADLATLTSLLSVSPVAGGGASLGIVFNPTTPNPNQSTFEDETVKH